RTVVSDRADRTRVFGITYSRRGDQDPVARGGPSPYKIDRGSLPEKDVFAASPVRHPSTLESLQRGAWLCPTPRRHTQADASQYPLQKLGLSSHVPSPF